MKSTLGSGGFALEASFTGMIAMWHGLIAAIPAGWALCDGASGTPDLRDRFVKGAAVGIEAGGLAGAATHQHSLQGGHTHNSQGGHTHDNHVMLGTPDVTGNPYVTSPVTHASGGAHTHDAFANHQHDSLNHEPLHYVIIYIMRL